jgi:hypothetical protein
MAGFFGESMEDPRTQMILAMAGGLLGNRGNLAQGMSAGLMAGLPAYQSAQKMQLAQEEARRRNAALEQEAEIARMKIDAMKRPQSSKRVVGNAIYDEATGQWEMPPKPEATPEWEPFNPPFKMPRAQPLQRNVKTGEIKPIGPGEFPPMQFPFQLAAQQQAKGDARERVSANLMALKDAYEELQAVGGAIKTGGPLTENVANRAMSSGIGQEVGRAIGTQSQAARDRINNLRPLLIQEIRQATQMGAKGLDSNAELQFYLQAATDPSRDIDTNMAAIETLDKAYGLGLGITAKRESRIKIRDEFSGASKAGPKPGTVVDGYRFKGGDPKNQSNWEAVK